MAGDGPEYGWLYGGKGDGPDDGKDPEATRPVRRPERRAQVPPPDATRMMPTQPRPGADSSGRTTRPTPPPVAPPVDPPSARGGRGFRRPRFRVRYVFLLLLAWLVFLVAVPVISWTSVDKIDFEPDGDRPGDQSGTTYLMVGTDSRKDLSKEERQELSTGGAAGSRTDTIMLLHTGSGPNVLMSVPRDAEVEIPGFGTNKINAAYAFGGPQLLVQTVEGLTGIRIDEYVEIGMGGVAGVVDAVGGIEICPTERMRDPMEDEMADPTSLDAVQQVLEVEVDLEADRLRTLRNNIRSRHSLALHELMSEREDLHGVHPLADHIADSLRWSA